MDAELERRATSISDRLEASYVLGWSEELPHDEPTSMPEGSAAPEPVEWKVHGTKILVSSEMAADFISPNYISRALSGMMDDMRHRSAGHERTWSLAEHTEQELAKLLADASAVVDALTRAARGSHERAEAAQRALARATGTWDDENECVRESAANDLATALGVMLDEDYL